MAADHLVAVRTPQTLLWLDGTGICPLMTCTLAKRKLNLFPRFQMISKAAWCSLVRLIEASPAIRALKGGENPRIAAGDWELGPVFREVDTRRGSVCIGDPNLAAVKSGGENARRRKHCRRV